MYVQFPWLAIRPPSATIQVPAASHLGLGEKRLARRRARIARALRDQTGRGQNPERKTLHAPSIRKSSEVFLNRRRYSSRSTCIGSTRAAMLAGRNDAAAATNRMIATT